VHCIANEQEVVSCPS